MGHKVSKATTKIEDVSGEGVERSLTPGDDKNSGEPAAKYQNFIVGHEDSMGAEGGAESSEVNAKSSSAGRRQNFGRRNSKICPSLVNSEEGEPSVISSEVCKCFITVSASSGEHGESAEVGKEAGSDHATSGRGAVPVPVNQRKELGMLSTMEFYNMLMEGHTSPYLFDPHYVLIIDTREKEEYESLHIITAVHVTVLSESLMVSDFSKYVHIILYDKDGRTHCLTESPMSQLQMRLKDFEPEVLEGGFDAWLTKHPYLCTDEIIFSELQREEMFFTYPSMILEDWLYQGAGQHATNEKIISDLGITHVINVGLEHPSPFKVRMQYFEVRVTDDPGSNIINIFPKATDFMRQAKQSKGKVLVHCNLGVSRSSAVILAYLITEFHWTLMDAYKVLKNTRNVVRPNLGFLKQLSEYEERIFGKKLTDIDEIHFG
ncbi:probable rhodanese domain-containing dual specificity protein phosphatase [Lingula anatina]|uniref:protein-tyrosine-phosphatase n=1 Tax=Lingula anatina TaxID=7574 RepID=A0A1S3I250_LINAN|nr:probable rhodanese domain-containing dual specificity protein phosphatase [Lingula anatina]|eukprot:XP_013392323.1 probable rhodanese domain-containing dual specificity protein phosphatase [Lingula anatina]